MVVEPERVEDEEEEEIEDVEGSVRGEEEGGEEIVGGEEEGTAPFPIYTPVQIANLRYTMCAGEHRGDSRRAEGEEEDSQRGDQVGSGVDEDEVRSLIDPCPCNHFCVFRLPLPLVVGDGRESRSKVGRRGDGEEET